MYDLEIGEEMYEFQLKIQALISYEKELEAEMYDINGEKLG